MRAGLIDSSGKMRAEYQTYERPEVAASPQSSPQEITLCILARNMRRRKYEPGGSLNEKSTGNLKRLA